MSVESETGEHLAIKGMVIPDLHTIVAESRTGVHAMASWFLKYLEENGTLIGGLDKHQEMPVALNEADSMGVHYWYDGSEVDKAYNPDGSGQIQTGTDNIQVIDFRCIGGKQIKTPRIIISAPRVYPIGQVYTEIIDDTPKVSVIEVLRLGMRDLNVGPEASSAQRQEDGRMAISHTEMFIADLRCSRAYHAEQLAKFGKDMSRRRLTRWLLNDGE